MVLEAELIDIDWKVDDRGFLAQIFDSNIDVKRVYVVGNFSKGTIRGFHGHMKEWKHFFVIKGCAKVVIVPHKVNEPPKNPEILKNRIKNFTLSDKRPCVLSVPPEHYNGWVSLEEGTILMGISNKTLDESKNDDYRLDPFAFGDVWSVKAR